MVAPPANVSARPLSYGRPDPVLSVAGVGHNYGARAALSDVTFDVPRGRTTMLIGPNGAGKTTLFSLICRLLPLRDGRITLCGEDLATAGNHVLALLGIVFQQQTLDLDLSVSQNLSYYAALNGLPAVVSRKRMAAALERVGLVRYEKSRIRQLNGGHRRRVEIARVLMTEPQLLLLDEPTVGLDMTTRRDLVEFLHRLAADEDIAILWATHLSDEVRGDDEVMILAQGRIKMAGRSAELVAAAGAADLDQLYEDAVRDAEPNS